MTEVRESPSGPKVAVGGAVSSVFGRQGAVVAVAGDYDTDQVENVSTVPGATASEALNSLLTTDGIQNVSSVSGATVTDALNTLLASAGGGTGSFSETFTGGTAATVNASSTNANIGNAAWNYITAGTATGNSCVFIPGETGAVGIRRITSPTAAAALANLYLGSTTAAPFDASNWANCTWRARFDSVQGTGEKCQIGVMSVANAQLGTNESAGFFGQLTGTGSSPNYQTITSHSGAGNTPQNTGVPIDGNFHDFKIVRVGAGVISFFIDGVHVTDHTTGNGDGMPTGALMPIGGAVGGGASTFIDLDDFNFAAAS
jgi:hypothetical protein